MRFLVLKIIRVYQKYLSPLLGPSCRFHPTCSEYAIECLKTYGLMKGFLKATKRILSCHPFSKRDGFDPVVKELKARK